MRLLKLFALLATLTAAVAAVAQADPGEGDLEKSKVNLEVILRDVTGGRGFGHVKFRQPKDDARIIYLDTWVRDLEPNREYLLQRQVDSTPDGDCSDAESLLPWLTLGDGFEAMSITTDDRGTGRAPLSRDLDPPGPMTGPPAGTEFDIHFRVVDKLTSVVVLQSGCYQYVVTQ
jgi:hypothetical protein